MEYLVLEIWREMVKFENMLQNTTALLELFDWIVKYMTIHKFQSNTKRTFSLVHHIILVLANKHYIDLQKPSLITQKIEIQFIPYIGNKLDFQIDTMFI